MAKARAKPRRKTHALVIVRYAGRILLGRMNTKKLSITGTPFPWGLPGGGVQKGEPALRAAKRELRQEVRKRLPTPRFVYRGSVYDERDDRTFFVFSVALSQKEFRERVPPHREFKEFRWFTLAELPWNEMLEEHHDWLPYLLNADATDPVDLIIRTQKPETV